MRIFDPQSLENDRRVDLVKFLDRDKAVQKTRVCKVGFLKEKVGYRVAFCFALFGCERDLFVEINFAELRFGHREEMREEFQLTAIGR
jgi:hypothetical protein